MSTTWAAPPNAPVPQGDHNWQVICDEGRIVGPVDSTDVVAVLEDTTTTGSAMFEAVEALTGAGIKVAQIVTLVDRSRGVAASKAEAAGIPYVALVTPSDLGVVE